MITLVQPQPGEAFNNHNIAFLLARYGLNIELIDTDEKAGLLTESREIPILFNTKMLFYELILLGNCKISCPVSAFVLKAFFEHLFLIQSGQDFLQ